MKTNTLNKLSKSELKALKEFYKESRDWESYNNIVLEEILEEYKDNEPMLQFVKILSKHRNCYSNKDYIEVSVEKVIKRTKYQTTMKPYLRTNLNNYIVIFSKECSNSNIIIRDKSHTFVLDLDLEDISDINVEELYNGQEYEVTFKYDDNVDYDINISNFD